MIYNRYWLRDGLTLSEDIDNDFCPKWCGDWPRYNSDVGGGEKINKFWGSGQGSITT